MKSLVFLLGAGLSLAPAGMLLEKKQAATQKTLLHTPVFTNETDTGITRVVHIAEVFKATLQEDQVALLQLPYTKEDAAKWSNFPPAFTRPKRVGINLGSLTQQQRAVADALISTVLSQGYTNEGYDEWKGILAADDYFGKATGKTDVFGAGNFLIAFLGKPSTTGLWELQFGGHHFAFANTYNGGKLMGTTPSFRGVEPNPVVKTEGRDYQPMEGELSAFASLIQSFNESEKTSAKLNASYSDVVVGPGKDGVFPTTKQGICAGKLNAEKQKAVIKAIELYVNDLDAAAAKEVMAKYILELPNTYVSYAGSGDMNHVGDYLRIDGPTIWVKYSAQLSRDFPGSSHPHSVWRDKKSDYGGN